MPGTLSNDGETSTILQDPLRACIHPLVHAAGMTGGIHAVPAWLDTPENVLRVMKTFLELLGSDHDVV